MVLERAKNTVLNHCTLNDNSGRKRISGFEQLRASIAEGAFHNSHERFDPPKCHPETRAAVLDMILAWVNNRQRTSSIMWLHGPAGAGKSAIAQTVAEMCEKAKTLCATFFFSRTGAKRNTSNYLIATIAYQLIRVIPQLEKPIIDAVESDSVLFSLSLQVQIQKLIVEPILGLMKQNLWTEDFPQLVIIDGLDECENPDIQKLILTVISEALISSNIPLCFLVASRPELAIREVFHTRSVQNLSFRIALDDKFKPEKDIETFLHSKFTEIKQTHQLRQSFPPDWPSDKDIQTLVRRSSGQFIYASVVMKYLGNPRKSPIKGLNIILGLVPPGNDTPYSQLDQLYDHILSTVANYTATSRVLGALLYIENRHHSLHLEQIPGVLDCLLLLESGDTTLLLSDLHSIIYVPNPENLNGYSALKESDSSDTRSIRILHASFSDFLIDASRSGKYYINKAIFYGDLALCCFQNRRHQIDYNEVQSTPRIAAQQHASLYSFHYLAQATMTQHLLDELLKLCTSDFLDVIKCGYSAGLNWPIINTIETDVLLVLTCLSLLTNNSGASHIFTSLQDAMDLHHLNLLLSRHSLSINETIYAVLGRIFLVDIWDCISYDPTAFGYDKRTTKHPIHLPYGVSRDYREWLLEFLSIPSRSNQYIMTKAHYQCVIFGILSWLRDPSYKPHDTDLQLMLSQISQLHDKKYLKDLRRTISKTHIEVSMRNDIWQCLISHERGSPANQSQSFKLPTVLMLKNDGKLYAADIDTEFETTDEEHHGSIGLDLKESAKRDKESRRHNLMKGLKGVQRLFFWK